MVDDNGAAAPPARLEELRALVDDALRGDCAATAVWYADKLATLSRGAVEDELRLARAYAAGGDPARAAQTATRQTSLRRMATAAATTRLAVEVAAAAPSLACLNSGVSGRMR